MAKRRLLLRNRQAPGDVVMVAYALKALHEQYPDQFVTGVDTSCNEIFEGNPYVTEMESTDPEADVLELGYPTINSSNLYPFHYVTGMTMDLSNKLQLPIRPTQFQNCIYIRDEERYWYSAPREKLGKDVPYWIVNAGHKSDFTAKAWDFGRYQQIIDIFPEITFVQIGHQDHIHPKLQGSNLINLVGKTDLRQLIRLVFNCFGVITPVSVPMVLSYAVPPHPRFGRLSRACVTIAGGREPNHWQQGPNQHYLHTCGMLDCCDLGGCWKSRVVPIGDGDNKDHSLCVDPVHLDNGQAIGRCMDMITVDDVANLIRKYVEHWNGC